ncbi:MAG: aldo/keto reductase [Eggerthellaceae bacterium]|nr:aldo/keto reductase [Eggerthellaceae bacterium]
MGFGCMRLPKTDPKDVSSIDIGQLKEMVDCFIEAGNTYFDTAYIYNQGHSEMALQKALTSRYPRDAYTIATKCAAWALPDESAAKQSLDVSLERLGVDYVDFYLLHNVGDKRIAIFDKYGLWDYYAQKKEEGLIRNFGFSMHDSPETLDKLLTEHPYMDFVQLQVNYLDWDNPVIQSGKCMEVAAKHGKPVVIMEPARGGRLMDLPAEVASILHDASPELPLSAWAYRFCWNLPNVLTVLSGMSNIFQTRENVESYRNNRPFTKAEKAGLDAAVSTLRDMQVVPCTNCRYCVKGCPQGVKIPVIMNLLNLEAMTRNTEYVKGLYSLQVQDGLASSCIQCGQCEGVCPQSIPIIENLELAAEKFE